ncbi:MAG TPA: FAD-binding oxidoreductase [Deltaproteobacteria bacterium]|jgi:ferredoxin-NADP reductase|nr:FAD-binding oxidoreductase [Deltaproteobacteria bacterium]HOI08163.1 FAD-binding oxidoreductase [Deltaproteobacteria bacterium]
MKDYRQEIEGYEQIRREMETLEKYGMGFTAMRGNVARTIDSLHPSRLRLTVSEIRQETQTAKTIRLVSESGMLPSFQAGQYITLFVRIGETRTSRPYSLSSAPHQRGFYDITVRRAEPGFVSPFLLDKLQVGDAIESSSPAGSFIHNPLFHGDRLVFLAGGSGITPFMSMIREATDRGLHRSIHLVYGSRSMDDIIFLDELEDRAARHPRFRVTHVISEPAPWYTGRCGFISKELLEDILDDIPSLTFYLCGPGVMSAHCLRELHDLGVPRRKIRTEMFGPPAHVAADPDWPPHVDPGAVFRVSLGNGPTIPAVAGEPLMVSLEKAGLTVASSCRSGECSLCRTRLVSGTVFHPRSAKLRKSDIRFGYIHPCVAYPLEDLEIEI